VQHVASATPHAKLSGAGLPWELHPACAAWPEMSPAELKDLAEDIAAHGLRDPITLDPDGLLLDGRNRALACVMAGVEPTTVVYDGDPWLFSLSRNKHRRHLTIDQIAMVAARMVTTSQGGDRRSEDFKTSNEGLTVKAAAKALEVPKTAVESARVVTAHGTPEEKKAIAAGKKGVLRKAADRVRSERRHAIAPPAPPKPKSAKPSADPIDDVACSIIAKCSDGKWRSLAKVASTVNVAKTAAKEALISLKEAGGVSQQVNGSEVEFRIESSDEAHLRRSLAAKDREIAAKDREIAAKDREIAAKDREIAAKDREIADLKARIAELEDEIERLAVRRDASSPAPSPAPASAPSLDMVYS